MLNIHHLYVDFVDCDTGEVIRKYHLRQATEDNVSFDIYQFLTSELLAKYIQSFRRGCKSHSNLSIQFNYQNEKIF